MARIPCWRKIVLPDAQDTVALLATAPAGKVSSTRAMPASTLILVNVALPVTPAPFVRCPPLGV